MNALESAERLLERLDSVRDGEETELGRAMLALPIPPAARARGARGEAARPSALGHPHSGAMLAALIA